MQPLITLSLDRYRAILPPGQDHPGAHRALTALLSETLGVEVAGFFAPVSATEQGLAFFAPEGRMARFAELDATGRDRLRAEIGRIISALRRAAAQGRASSWCSPYSRQGRLLGRRWRCPLPHAPRMPPGCACRRVPRARGGADVAACAVAAGLAALARAQDRDVTSLLKESFTARGIAGLDRLEQTPLQRTCSAYAGRDLPKDVRERIEQGIMGLRFWRVL
jgi:hypothetical protein